MRALLVELWEVRGFIGRGGVGMGEVSWVGHVFVGSVPAWLASVRV